MKSCVFCQIVAGELPAAIVHEDDRCVAFMDIHPLTPGHVLLIPRRHVEKLEELDASDRTHLYRLVDQLVAAQRGAGYGVEGTHLIVNDGKATNQHVPHVHLHLVPRRRGDSLGFFFRLLGHFLGLFGFRTRMTKLGEQAAAISRQLGRERS